MLVKVCKPSLLLHCKHSLLILFHLFLIKKETGQNTDECEEESDSSCPSQPVVLGVIHVERHQV